MHPTVTHGRSLAGHGQDRCRGKTKRPDKAGQVVHSQRTLKIPKVFKQAQPMFPVQHLAVLTRSESGSNDVFCRTRVADGRDRAVAGAGQRPGAFHNLRQDRIEIEACADAQAGCAQFGDAVAQHLDFQLEWVDAGQWQSLRYAGAALNEVAQQAGSVCYSRRGRDRLVRFQHINIKTFQRHILITYVHTLYT